MNPVLLGKRHDAILRKQPHIVRLKRDHSEIKPQLGIVDVEEARILQIEWNGMVAHAAWSESIRQCRVRNLDLIPRKAILQFLQDVAGSQETDRAVNLDERA